MYDGKESSTGFPQEGREGGSEESSHPSGSEPHPISDDLVASLEELTTVDLKKVIEHAQTLLERKTEGDRRSFIEEVTSRAKDMGMSVADLFGKAVPASLLPKTQGKGKAAGKKTGVALVKFRGPNGETWAGRGYPPRWLTALEAEGKNRSDFAV